MMRRRIASPRSWVFGPSVGQGRILADADVPAALRVCARDPVGSVLAASRLQAAARSGLRAAGGAAWGYPQSGPLQAICWAGANLVPVLDPALDAADREAAVGAFAELAWRSGRRSSSIVGERGAVLALWELLSDRWPAAREVRENQPSMAIDHHSELAADPLVRPTLPAELPTLLPACVRMFTEEVGYSPLQSGFGYEDRVRSLISAGRSFARTTGYPPTVVFKAEIGALTDAVAQIQGVWVDPDFRGRRISEAAMAAVVRYALERAPIVSLYVNDFNTAARAAYRRVGFEEVGAYATVLF